MSHHHVVKTPRPTPQRGDWFVTYSYNDKAPRCRQWPLPPSTGNVWHSLRGVRGAVFVLPYGTYFGPVHEVEHSECFVSVRVPAVYPAPDAGLWLIWINVWTSSGKGTSLAKPIAKETKLNWILRGWVDLFLSHRKRNHAELDN